MTLMEFVAIDIRHLRAVQLAINSVRYTSGYYKWASIESCLVYASHLVGSRPIVSDWKDRINRADKLITQYGWREAKKMI